MKLSKLDLNGQEVKMVLEGLGSLKSKDFTSEIISDLLKSMLIDKNKMTSEQMVEYETREAKEEESKREKESERERLKNKIDILKAKILLANVD